MTVRIRHADNHPDRAATTKVKATKKKNPASKSAGPQRLGEWKPEHGGKLAWNLMLAQEKRLRARGMTHRETWSLMWSAHPETLKAAMKWKTHENWNRNNPDRPKRG